jgi:hypothetical protein
MPKLSVQSVSCKSSRYSSTRQVEKVTRSRKPVIIVARETIESVQSFMTTWKMVPCLSASFHYYRLPPRLPGSDKQIVTVLPNSASVL